MNKLNVAIIGYKFMGKAHSNAWLNAPYFFQMSAEPVRKIACGRSEVPLRKFAQNWGWQETATDWREVVARDDIDIIDIAAPQNLHYEIAIAAARAGKHIFCEKPVALNYQQAKEMYQAAEEAGIVHYLNHNYRRCPAIMLAKQLITEGRIGKIYHWRSAYLQSRTGDPNYPFNWRFDKETAGSGPQGELNSHTVDLARFLIGEIKSVSGLTAQFIKERRLPDSDQKRKVTVEDAAYMLVEFESGTAGSFEATRFATGRKNYNYFEIYGSRGSLTFNLERLNELQFYSVDDPPHAQGFRTILATEPMHSYMSHWWPPGHIIGYEHAFVHAVADFLEAIGNNKKVEPNFYDGMKEMEILEAGLASAKSGQRIYLA